MRRRDLLVGAGGLAGGSSLIVSSNAFSTVEADRELQVEVVGDDEAYVTLRDLTNGSEGDVISPTITSESETFLEIENRFGMAIRIEDVATDSPVVSFAYDDDDIGPGESAPVEARVDIETDASRDETDSDDEVVVTDIKFDLEIVAATGEPVSADARITRTLDIEVELTNVETVSFNGGSNRGNSAEGSGGGDGSRESGGGTIRINAVGPPASLRATVYNDKLESASTELSTDSPKQVNDIAVDTPAVAVHFTELDLFFIRDESLFDSDDCAFGTIGGSQTVGPVEDAETREKFFECVE